MRAEDLKDPRDRAAAMRAEAGAPPLAYAYYPDDNEVNELQIKFGKEYTNYVKDWKSRVAGEVEAAKTPTGPRWPTDAPKTIGEPEEIVQAVVSQAVGAQFAAHARYHG